MCVETLALEIIVLSWINDTQLMCVNNATAVPGSGLTYKFLSKQKRVFHERIL